MRTDNHRVVTPRIRYRRSLAGRRSQRSLSSAHVRVLLLFSYSPARNVRETRAGKTAGPIRRPPPGNRRRESCSPGNTRRAGRHSRVSNSRTTVDRCGRRQQVRSTDARWIPLKYYGRVEARKLSKNAKTVRVHDERADDLTVPGPLSSGRFSGCFRVRSGGTTGKIGQPAGTTRASGTRVPGSSFREKTRLRVLGATAF